MVTLLEVIRRTAPIVDDILDNRKEHTKALMEYIAPKLGDINEIVFVGSGTSSTCAMTSKGFVERASGVKASVYMPNEFYNDRTAYNPNALYIFTSQSGNSIIARDCQRKMKDLGYLTVGITESPNTTIALEAGCHVIMGCGFEEYGCRTIGYCSSILTHMIIAMEIGLAKGHLSQEQYDAYIAEARKVPASHAKICDQTLAWFEKNKKTIMDCTHYVYFGAASLWGVALEGALKNLEISLRMSSGYEMEEGLHGPTMGFHEDTCVLILNGSDEDSKKALGLAEMCHDRDVKAFVIGSDVFDDNDLKIDVCGGAFKALEFAPTVEIFAYLIACEEGIDLTKPMEMPKKVYFETHDFETMHAQGQQ